MANDLNLCQFIGRLGKDPELRYLPDGKAVASLSIACGSSWKDKNSGEKQEKTEWIRISAFGKLAEIIGEYLKKGSQVYIAGRMQTREWEKDGVKRYTTEVVADQMQMLGGKPRDDDAPRDKLKEPTPGAGDFDDDIPF